jgi:hypothetical protein
MMRVVRRLTLCSVAVINNIGMRSFLDLGKGSRRSLGYEDVKTTKGMQSRISERQASQGHLDDEDVVKIIMRVL